MVDQIVDFLRPYFEGWGYAIVGSAAFLENSIGTGLVFPGETIVILGGFYAAAGDLSVVWVAVVAAIGGFAGDNVGYLIGRGVGRRLFHRFGRFVLLPRKRLEKAERFYVTHGGKTVFLGRFIPVVRSIGCVVAGMSHMRYPRFALFDLAGATLWAVGNTLVGYLLGTGYPYAKRYLGGAGLAALLLLIVLVWVSAIFARRRLARASLRAETRGMEDEAHGDR